MSLYALDPDQLAAIRKVVGASMKKKRICAKITRQQLEKASGLAYFTIRRIEEGTGDYKIDNLLLFRGGIRRILQERAQAKDQQNPQL